jgi:hypothetical protein
MAINCPICGESFEDGRGLHGHLRFKENLSGEELEERFQEAKDQSADEEESDPVLQHVKRVALHHGISPLEVVKKIRRPMATGSPWGDLELEGGGFFSQSEEKEAAEEMLSELEDRLKKEREKVGEELNSILQKQIKEKG